MLTQQKDLLEYQEMCLCNDINDLTEEIGEYELNNEDGCYDNEIAYFEAYQESYDSQNHLLNHNFKQSMRKSIHSTKLLLTISKAIVN